MDYISLYLLYSYLKTNKKTMKTIFNHIFLILVILFQGIKIILLVMFDMILGMIEFLWNLKDSK